MPGDSRRGTTRGVQTGDVGAARFGHPCVLVDDETSLGVEQRRHDPHCGIRRCEGSLEEGPAQAVGLLPSGDRGCRGQLDAEGIPFERSGFGQLIDRVGPDQRPALDRLPEVGERQAQVMDSLVEDEPALGLRS